MIRRDNEMKMIDSTTEYGRLVSKVTKFLSVYIWNIIFDGYLFDGCLFNGLFSFAFLLVVLSIFTIAGEQKTKISPTSKLESSTAELFSFFLFLLEEDNLG